MPQKNDLKAIQTVQHSADLAALRNQLTTVQTGTEIASMLLEDYGFKTHPEDNCVGMSEAFTKKYLLNLIDTVLDGFLTAFNAMKDKGTEILEFLDKIDGNSPAPSGPRSRS